MMRSLLVLALILVTLPLATCDRGGERQSADETEVQVDPELGTLVVSNRTTEPVAIHLDGQELYAVQPGRAATIRNLPHREVNIYGVGRISGKHYSLPRLTIEEGGDYEWTIRP